MAQVAPVRVMWVQIFENSTTERFCTHTTFSGTYSQVFNAYPRVPEVLTTEWLGPMRKTCLTPEPVVSPRDAEYATFSRRRVSNHHCWLWVIIDSAQYLVGSQDSVFDHI